MSFDFINNENYNNPGVNSGFGAPVPNRNLDAYGIPQQQVQQQQPMNMYQQIQQNRNNPQQKPYVDPRMYETPKIVSSNNPAFQFVAKDNNRTNNTGDVHVDEPIVPESRRRGRPAKTNSNLPANTGSSGIIRAKEDSKALSGSIENVPTAYTYMETTNMLHRTLSQIDSISDELMGEFEMVRANRAMKNKYGILANLSENIGDLIANKIAAIKEINNSISKSNDLDYKRYKDNKEQLNQTDDKYISDLYTSFLQNNNNPQIANMPTMSSSIYGSSGIVRADLGGQQNAGNIQYTNYIANITPEERLMLLEGNNNIKQAMVYDPATGNRAFQYFDFSNPNNPIPQPGLPTYSDILLNEFTIDLVNRKAKSTNLKETMDLIIVNGNTPSTY